MEGEVGAGSVLVALSLWWVTAVVYVATARFGTVVFKWLRHRTVLCSIVSSLLRGELSPFGTLVRK